jgi:curved DNA-binding protein CbpA
MLNYYELLGVSATADPGTLKAAYRQRIRALHPDRFTDNPAGLVMAGQMAVLLNTAWETLGQPDSRAVYDADLRRGAVSSGSSGAPASPAPRTPGHSTAGSGAPGNGSATRGPAGPSAPRSGSTSTGPAPRTAQDLLVSALAAAQDTALREHRTPHTRGEVAELAAPLLSSARRHQQRALGTREPAAAPLSVAVATDAAGLAIAAAYRDVLSDTRHLRGDQRDLTRTLAAAALDALGSSVELTAASWLEQTSEPRVPAQPRWLRAQLIRVLGCVTAAVGAAAAGVEGGWWKLQQQLTFLPRHGTHTGSGSAMLFAILVCAVGVAGCWFGARQLRRGGAPVPAQPVQLLHLDDVDRLRFAAGRSFGMLPESPPTSGPTAPPAPASRPRRFR